MIVDNLHPYNSTVYIRFLLRADVVQSTVVQFTVIQFTVVQFTAILFTYDRSSVGGLGNFWLFRGNIFFDPRKPLDHRIIDECSECQVE